MKIYSKTLVSTICLSLILNVSMVPLALALVANPSPSTGGGSTMILNGGFTGQGSGNTGPSIDPASSGGLGGFGSSAGTSGGGAGSACTQGIVTQAVIFGTIMGLSAVANVVGVPTGNISSDLGSAFNSAAEMQKFLKDNCLDPAARAIYKKMLVQTEQSVLNWANNGFKGGPLDGATFPSDLQGYLGSVRDAATDTWVSDQNRNNFFYDDIVRQVYQESRANPQDEYTPDLAETIAAAECSTYQQEQQRSAGAASNSSNSSGIFTGVSRFIQGIFDTNTYPSNNPGFGNGDYSNGRGILDRLGSSPFFNFNDLLLQTVYAQTQANRLDAIVNSPDIQAGVAREQGRPSIPAVEDYLSSDEYRAAVARESGTTSSSPCTRSLATRAEKQAIIEQYTSGQIALSPETKWQVFRKEYECRNRRDCVVLKALQQRDTARSTAVSNEQTVLANNNGNTGARECINYLPQSRDARASGEDRQCRSDGYRITTPGVVVGGLSLNALTVPLENINKLTSTGTFADVAQAVLNGLINNITSQVTTNGLFSFNSRRANTNNAGDFTRGIGALNATSNFTSDVSGGISRSNAYVSVLNEKKTALTSLLAAITATERTCASGASGSGSFGGLLLTGGASNSACNTNPYTLDYKNDPTAGAKLAQSALYNEQAKIDSTRAALEQTNTALTNARTNLGNLERARTTYQTSRDVNKEANYSAELARLTITIPGDEDINAVRASIEDLNKRLSALEAVRAAVAPTSPSI